MGRVPVLKFDKGRDKKQKQMLDRQMRHHWGRRIVEENRHEKAMESTGIDRFAQGQT